MAAKGSYVLVMKLDEDKAISIGSKGAKEFPRGYYCYVGSALSGLEKRISRHRSKEKKRFWHIDYFLDHAKIVYVKKIESQNKIECKISRDLERLSDKIPVKGFGCSDCRNCRAHLYWFDHDPNEKLNGLVVKWKT